MERNPFDQFDTVTPQPPPVAAQARSANPFDQFDSIPSPAPQAQPKPAQPGFLEGLSNIRMSQILKGIYEAGKGGFDLTNDVIAGRVDPRSDEAIKKSFEAVGVFNPITPASRFALAPVAQAAAEVAPQSQMVQAGEQIGVPVPRFIASDATSIQRMGQTIRNVPIVGNRVQQAGQEFIGGLERAAGNVADDLGTATGPNAANRIGSFLQSRAANEISSNASAAAAKTQAAEQAAQQAFQTRQAQMQSGVSKMRNDAASLEVGARQRTARTIGEMDPQDMGQRVIDGLRSAEQKARATKEAAYTRASGMDATISADAVQSARGRVQQALADEGVIIDGTLTPAASRMLDEVQQLASLNIQNKAAGASVPGATDQTIAGVTIQGIEQARKRLNSISRAATNDADRRASTLVRNKFDEWLDDAVDTVLFSGSREALDALKTARAANADWRARFGYNAKTDADKILNKIVNGEVTTNEVSNWVLGATRVGAAGSSARLLNNIAAASPEVLPSIKSGVWSRLSQTASGVVDKPNAKAANEIFEFLNGSGRPVAEKMFSESDRNLMTAYAKAVRQADSMREVATAFEKRGVDGLQKIKPAERAIGDMERLAEDILGRGRPTDEALFAAIDGYAKSGSRGDIQTLGSLIRILPQGMKDDLAGAIVRNIGVSPRTKEWSPDVFASQWSSYSPQSKALLFGVSGKHRADLDAIATLGMGRRSIVREFGNASGTAQNYSGFAIGGAIAGATTAAMTGQFVPALKIAGGLMGGVALSQMLAKPAGASSMSKWVQAYQAIGAATTPAAQYAKLLAYQQASQNLISNMGGQAGRSLVASDFMRALSGPVRSPAEEQSNPQP